jgi:hypothetical protein
MSIEGREALELETARDLAVRAVLETIARISFDSSATERLALVTLKNNDWGASSSRHSAASPLSA